MQQFLIPSSTGSSQIINIPVSLLSQSSQQPISFITANGQIFQIPSFSQLVVHQNSDGTTSTTSAGGTTQQTTSSGGQNTITTNTSGTTQLTAANVASSSTTASAAQQQSSNSAANAAQQQQQQQQTLVINHQGQIISLPVLQPTASGQVSHQQQIQTQRVSTSGSNSVSVTNSSSNNGTTPIKTLLEDDEKSDTNSIDDQGPTIANIPTASSSQPGMPHHNQITHATTVDGVNLDEIREFAKAFKLRRLALGLTQTQVGQALSATKGPAYSQSAICRFEKLDITPKSAAKIKPVLEKWMQEAELKYADRLKTGSHQNFADLLGTENTKKRKRRTSFTPQALEILNEYFEKNTHPSGSFNIGNQGADMTMLAQKLNYDREVIRVWFCNKRQALKNTLKKLKQNESGGGMESSDHSDADDSSQMNTSLPSSQSIQQHQIIVQQQQQQQPQVIQVVQAGQTVASALDSASHSNELTLIKQEATNHAKTVVTLTSGSTNNNTNGSSSNSSSPETDPVLLVVNAIAAGVASSNSSTNNNNNNNNNNSNNTTTSSSSSSSAVASSATPATQQQQQQQTDNQTESTSDNNSSANGTSAASNGASTSAQASNSTTSASTVSGGGGVEVIAASSDNQ